MLLQKRVSIISLVWSLSFLLLIALQFLAQEFDFSLYFIIRPFEFLFGWPLYIFIFVSFIITGIKCLIDMNRENFKYFIYTCISGTLVVGVIVALIVMLGDALANF
ncbi:hypothetical protein [Candidatus Xianfuyuplasma coldseepsis]|uniref:Uncharacterized protein n=1 Tax=Candidatus Xianfuyuplasma coldseepsis TaxID=2782163 RepID=A0A7L7KVF5_9MOLU|nr:hypothetical protein [Xianfuyuplasma coldseepsis]QMS85738.1 hypothetical protein G4Z02_08270 [Xianfuyuplasma coldseepsis]